MEPVFDAYMAAIGATPADAVQDRVDPDILDRLKALGLNHYDTETVAGRRVVRIFSAWLSPDLEYLYSRETRAGNGKVPAGGILKVHRSGFPATVVAAMRGETVGRFIEHPLLPRDMTITGTSDLRPQFDIVNLWFGPDAGDKV